MIKVMDYRGVKVFQGKVSFFGVGAMKTFAYLWDGNLVDTGPGRLERDFVPEFMKNRINNVLLTHFHEDHSGNAALIQEKRNVPVFASAESLNLLKNNANLPLYRRYVWGKRPLLNPVPYIESVESDNGRLEVIKTPGHSHDHVCLLNRDAGLLFTGDLFVTPKTRIVMRNESIPQIIGSLRRLLRETFDTLFCAHAGVVERGREILEKKLSYLEQISGEVLYLHSRGLPIREIDRKLFGKTQILDYISSGEWSSRHIVTSIISGNMSEV